jgi:hypothetical protein
MPLLAQRLNNRINHGLPTLPTLCTKPMRMTIHTPCIPFLFYKRRARVERITTLRTEKVAGVPLCSTRYNDFALDRRLARFTPGAEHLVEIQVAEEALGFVGAVLLFEGCHVGGSGVGGGEREVFAALAGAHTSDTFGELFLGFGVKGDTFEVLAALVAGEAFGVEAGACGGDDAAGYGEGALGAEGAGADVGWRPVRASVGCSEGLSPEVLWVW